MENVTTGLEHDHSPEAIQKRLADGCGQGHLSDVVLGAMDGSITTFTIVAGAVGGGLSGTVVVILGMAKVFADAFSMAASNFLSRRSEQQEIEQARSMEKRHIELAPDGEREEVRQIYWGKGFRGELLEEIVRVLAEHPAAWVETMVREEHRLAGEPPRPLRAATATFFAFLAVGMIPLAPFLFASGDSHRAFLVSASTTALVIILIGVIRGGILNRSPWKSGLESLLIGGVAAAVAYGIGCTLRQTFGVA